ncbi:hypothetical protein ACOALA_20645 (plasmid) [Alicyclobacillus acidoterrestris]|uniref:hypothetical protein n=1 Tax=Alicyclobacillus acidoterrestris TaxID=1450 RepID=UPI003F52F5B6
MQKKTKLWSALGVAALAGVTTLGLLSQNAYAYSAYPGDGQLGYGDLAKAYGVYQIDGGDTIRMTSPGYPELNGQSVNTIKTFGVVDGDSDGQWPFVQADILGENANNGYLLIGSTAAGSSNIQDWVNRLGGNLTYVNRYLSQNGFSDMEGYDSTNFNTFHFASFAAVLTACAASVTENDITPTGETDSQGNPVYKSVRHIQTTNPPTADSINVSVSGGQATLTLKSTEDIPSGDYTHHYDAVQVTNNSTGQSSWLLGTDQSDMTDMQVESGGNGAQTDTETVDVSSLAPGNYTATFYVRDGVDRAAALPATTTFTIGQPAGITLTANPTSLNVGQSSTLVATAQNVSVSANDQIKIYDQAAKGTLSGGQNVYAGQNGATTATTTATDSTAETNHYIADLLDANGNIIAESNTVAVTWNSTDKPTITIFPKTNDVLNSGDSEKIYYEITGMDHDTNYQNYHVIITPIDPENVSNAWNTQDDTNWDDTYIEAEHPANGDTASVSYEAQLVNNDTGQVVDTDTSGTFTWKSVAPGLTFTASPTQLKSGQVTNLSYKVTNMAGGDYVSIQGTGGQNMWNETEDTESSGKSTEIETPYNGGTTTVQYTAELHDMTGKVIATQTATITWTSAPPTITMSASSIHNVPGEPDTIRYTVDQQLPPIDYVNVVPSGNGVDPWSATDAKATNGSFIETEDPSAGQTITETYVATIYDSTTENPISSSTITVDWYNPWNGTVQLTASPQFLPTGQSTTLTATTSQSIPDGYTLMIMDQTTGQMVSQGSSSPESSQYASFDAETDTFVAYVYDGYEQVGNPSNTVDVTWSALSLSADPQQLPAGDKSELTVTGQNVPSGDYLVVYNQSTGQEVGYSQSTPYSVQVSEATPVTDTFVAYISANTDSSGALITSNTVNVDWYGVTLTANPTRLPIKNTSLLTAQAQNIPNGYVLDIVDQTTNQTIATGEPGQTTLEAYQTKSQAETDKYVAQVVQPGNPTVPGLSVPSAQPSGLMFGADTSTSTAELGIYDTGSGNYRDISVPYLSAGQLYVLNKVVDGQVFMNATNGIESYNPSTAQWTHYADPSDSDSMTPLESTGSNGLVISVDVTNNHVIELNPSTNTWTDLGDPNPANPVGHQADGASIAFVIDAIAYDPDNGHIYAGASDGNGTYHHNGDGTAYNAIPSLYDYNPSTHAWAEVEASYWDGNGSFRQGNLIYFPAAHALFGVLSDAYNGATDTPFMYNIDTQSNMPVSFSSPSTYSSNLGYLMYDATTQTVLVSDTYFGYLGPITYEVYRFDKNGNDVGSSGVETTVYDSSRQTYGGWLQTYSYTGGIDYNYQDTFVEYNASTGAVTSLPGSPPSAWIPVAYVQTNSGVNVSEFPFWNMSSMPSYIPSSVFTQAASAAADGKGFWVNTNTTVANGTAWFESQFTTSSNESVTVTMPNAPTGIETVFIDGQPVLQDGNNPAALPGVTTGLSTTVTLPAGPHQVVIEGTQTNGFSSSDPSPSHVSLTIADGSSTLVNSSATSWRTTGYVTQLPAGWFSGAVGTYSFIESVFQEGQSSPIKQQQSYTVTNAASDVSATSAPVDVTWYLYDLQLSADPTELPDGYDSHLTATTDEAPAGDVIEIYDETTSKVVGDSSQGALTFTAQYAEPNPTTDTFVAYLKSANGTDATSNEVQVTWQQLKLTLEDPEVYHTDAWLANLQAYNDKYQVSDPSLLRSTVEFWAGEELKFKVFANIKVAQAFVTIQGLQMSPYAPANPPVDFTRPITIPLTLDSTTGYLEGNTDPSWEPWMQYIEDGTYQVTFYVKSADNQVASATASFTIDKQWVSGSDPGSYYHEHQTY